MQSISSTACARPVYPKTDQVHDRTWEKGFGPFAAAAFEGALRYHPDYADVHYHLARTLDEMGHRRTAEQHWRRFLALAPDSPWAAEAQQRIA